jgi:hypothetical protein
MHPSTSPSTDLGRTKNSKAFREEFIKILKSVNMEADSVMQGAAMGMQAGQTWVS